MLGTLNKIGNDAQGMTSINEALERFSLDWTVEKRPTFYELSDGSIRAMPQSFATIRSDNENMLGRVGGDYMPMSNGDALKHVDALLESGIAQLDSVFELRGGRRVGASLRLKNQITLAGEDLIDMYIVVTTSHDGTRADRTEITPIRLFCTNQLAVKIPQSAKQSWSVRHLGTMADNLKLVEEELKMITNYTEWLEKTGNDMINKTLREVELRGMLEEALKFSRDVKGKEKMTGEIAALFNASPLIGGQYLGTAWAGINAVTEYFDHHRKYRSAQARYEAITNGVGARVRNSMFEQLVSL
jgi:phage/plasmid-like protein (TIGR03299 family)